jgi:hypothetical protein
MHKKALGLEKEGKARIAGDQLTLYVTLIRSPLAKGLLIQLLLLLFCTIICETLKVTKKVQIVRCGEYADLLVRPSTASGETYEKK